jgi:hypothetical protein
MQKCKAVNLVCIWVRFSIYLFAWSTNARTVFACAQTDKWAHGRAGRHDNANRLTFATGHFERAWYNWSFIFTSRMYICVCVCVCVCSSVVVHILARLWLSTASNKEVSGLSPYLKILISVPLPFQFFRSYFFPPCICRPIFIFHSPTLSKRSCFREQ